MNPAIRRVLTSRYFYVPVGALLFYTVLGFVVIPFTVRWYVPRYARDSLNCQAAMTEVRLNPFLLTFEIRGFEIKQGDGTPLASFERFFADLQARSLFRWALIFGELSLESPVVHAIVEPDGGLNLKALVPRKEPGEEPPPTPDSKPFRMLLENMAVLGGKVVVIDRRQSKPAELVVEMFDLKLRDLSTLQDYNGSYLFTTTTPEGERFQWQGEIQLAPFRSSGSVAVNALRLDTLWEFFRDAVQIERPGGLVDIQARYELDMGQSPMRCVLKESRVDVSDLSLKLSASPQAFLEWKRLEVDVPSVDLVEKRLQVKNVLLDGCALDARRDPSGVWSLLKIARETPTRKESEEPAPSPEPRATPPPEPSVGGPEGSPFSIIMDNLEIRSMSVAFEDASPTAPMKGGCSRIDVKLKASLGPDGKPGPPEPVAGASASQAAASSPGLRVEGLGLSLGELHLKLADSEKALIDVKKVEVDAPLLDLTQKSLQLSRILVEGGAVDVHVDGSGLSNVERVARSLGQSPKGGRSETREATPEPAAPPAGQEAGGDPFRVSAESVDIRGMALGFSDSSREIPVNALCSQAGLHFKASLQVGAGAPEGTVSDLTSELMEIQVRDTQSPEPVFRTGKLTVEGGECSLGARSIVVPRIALGDGHVDVSRDAEGRLNWLRMAAAGDAARESRPSPAPSSPESPWKILIKALELDGFRSRLSDLAVQPDKPLLEVQGFKARLTDVDGKSPLGFTVDFQAAQGGTVSLSGRVDPEVPSVDARVNVADFSLTSLQPYLEPFVTLVLRSAAVSTQGSLSYGSPGGGARLVYDGGFKLSKLKLTEANTDQTYLGLGSLQAPRLKLTLEPDGFEAGEVRVSGLVGELIIAEDRTINLTRVVKTRGGTDERAAPPPRKGGDGKEGGFPFKIGKVLVDDGNVVFADLSLRPKFSARIHDLKGVISGLSSARDTKTRLQLDGRVDRFGLARINGVLQLYDFQRSAEIDMVFRNVEMTSLSPYSGKFAGRQIKSGRLSTDLKYRIENRKLVGDNKIIVENLVLGEHVDSPDAVNLPLDLAVALLKDSQGRIDIGLPVSGDLDNPEFSIGPFLWKAFVTLITKAVTAPFRALGSLFGGEGEEFSSVSFEAGSADLLPPERENLQKLAGALAKRPKLKLILRGRFSPGADGTELKDLSVRRAVAKRQGSGLKPDEDPGPLDLADSSNRKALESLFEERFGKDALRELSQSIKSGAVKPRMPEVHQPDESRRGKKGFFSRMANNLKLYKVVPGGRSPEEATLWAGELYLRLVESEPLQDEVLFKLADRRAQAVAQELEGEGGVPAERLTVEKSEALTDDSAPMVNVSLGAL
ncbi:MAG: DUF748 domain-containing protein [Syntrophobacteraceae bacterium]|nr:DUF748 domain-containing protein [Syntrophobacteraceae bacterium]